MRFLFVVFICIVSTTVISQDFDYFQSFDDSKIAYLDEGEGSAVLFLHGFISNGNSWYGTELKKQLIDSGFRVIIPDMRGNGKSDIPQNEGAYKGDAEVKDLIALISHLGLDRLDAVGYSRGSIVLSKLLTIETRIDKAVLGGMGIDFTQPDWDRRIMFMNAFLGLDPLNDDTAGAVNYAKSINADIRVLGLLQKYQPVTSKEELEDIETKILVIAGDEDLDNGNPKKLSKCLKNAKLVIVPGDHNTTYRKKPFAEEVMKFLID